MAAITLSDIPTLTALYADSTLNKVDSESRHPHSSSLNNRIGLIRADITNLQVDAIVNAANESLRGGGGVDGAIHRAAGPELLKECLQIGGCATGRAVITKGYGLPAKHVIHTVGPVYRTHPGQAEELLKSCYNESLRVAHENGLKSVAFSAISTGIYGYPSKEAAMVACEAARRCLDQYHEIERVVFVTFEEKDREAYSKQIPKTFPPADE